MTAADQDPGPAPTAEETAERFLQNYVRFQYAFIEFLAEHLTDVSREFGGDLQPPMILAVLGQRILLWQAEADRAVAGEGTPPWSPTMATARIADVTGIPRETVRRKLADLEARGWIARDADGKWGIARVGERAPARDALAELDRRGVARVAKLHTVLRDLT
ncbi:MAG: helix-turn-helix domain-containing protein [Alphaproteobacteria bacterium]|jgi:DNA-binding transcriptional ArsR family regulator|nr:helix-turn-helix domain-containing protein [Alphaproteobacteria bacterium]